MIRYMIVLVTLLTLPFVFSTQAQETQAATVTGTVAEIVSPNAFLLTVDDTAEFMAGEEVLVFPGNNGQFRVDINMDMRVRVTGQSQSFEIATLESDLGYDLDDDAFTNYTADNTAIIASYVQRLSALEMTDEATLSGISANPEDYFGQVLTVDGIAKIVSANAFELTSTSPFTFPGSILVFPAQDDFSVNINNNQLLQVTGELRAFDLAAIESDLGFEVDEKAFTDFGIYNYVMIANSVTVLRAADLVLQEDAAALAANPQNYLEQTIIVDGTAEIVSPNAFRLTNTDPFRFEPTDLLVFAANGEFGVDINNFAQVQVVGQFVRFDFASIESNLGIDLDDEAFTDFTTDDYAIVAQSVVVLDPVKVGGMDTTDSMGNVDTTVDDPAATLDSVTDNPEAYYGLTVSVVGEIDGLVADGTGGIIIEDDDLIADEEVLVIGATQDILSVGEWSMDDEIMVTGIVRPFSIVDLENEIGYDLDDELYAGYENYTVIVTSNIGWASE